MSAPRMTANKANRGKYAEGKVKDYLQNISNKVAQFDYERLPDARSAMGRFKSMVGDFVWFYPGKHGVIEVKETQHDYRIAKDKIPQLARMKKRVLAGGKCLVIVYHSTSKLWRVINVNDLPIIERGSWDLSGFPTFKTLNEATVIIED